MDSKIIDYLKKEGRPRIPLHIAKGVGKTTAKDVNPTLYRLEEEGLIQRIGTVEGRQAPLWGLVQGGSACGNYGQCLSITARMHAMAFLCC